MPKKSLLNDRGNILSYSLIYIYLVPLSGPGTEEAFGKYLWNEWMNMQMNSQND